MPIACLALALLAAAGSLAGNAYIWTDHALVAENEWINSVSGLAQLWTGIASPSTYPLPQYAPLAQTTFFLERMLGVDQAWMHRVVSAVLHGLVGIALWRVLAGLRVRGAAIVALLFVVHPLTVEPIAWLSERRGVLAALLGLWSLELTLRAIGVIAPPPTNRKLKLLPDERSRLAGLAGVLFLLGLFASATTIGTLPLVALLIRFLYRPPVAPPAHKAATPAFVGGAVIATSIALVAALFSAAVEQAHADRSPTNWARGDSFGTESIVRTQIAGKNVISYSARFLVPLGLTIDYPRLTTPADVNTLRARVPEAASRRADVGGDDFRAFLPPLCVAGLLIVLWNSRKRGPYTGPFVALAAYVLLLLPSLGFVDLGWMRYAFYADRAAYLAITAPLALIVAGAAHALDARATWRKPACIVAGAIGLLWLALDVRTGRRYRDELAFWNDAAQRNPQSWLAGWQLALAYERQRPTPNLDAAARAIDGALQRHPWEPALIVEQLRLHLTATAGPPDDASLQRIGDALRVTPNYPPAQFTAGEIFRRRADARSTDPAPRYAALKQYADAAAADPKDALARIRVGQTCFEIIRRLDPKDQQVLPLVDQAAAALTEATQLRPFDIDTLIAAARGFIAVGKVSDAGFALQGARAIDPDNAQLALASGETLLAVKNYADAEKGFKAAIERDPSLIDAHLSLAVALEAQDKNAEAIEALEKAATIAPDNALVRQRLAEARVKRATTIPSPMLK